MKKEQLMVAAVQQFAQFGYEGTSMAMIAEAVGIKKQSIYSHFKNKDDLFLAVCKQCATEELAFGRHEIGSMQQNPKKLLVSYMERFQQNEASRFWLRMMFFPPQHLEKDLLNMVEQYIDSLEQEATDYFMHSDIVTKQIVPEQIAKAYLALLDSIFVELLYGNERRAATRLEASFAIFMRGIQKKEEV